MKKWKIIPYTIFGFLFYLFLPFSLLGITLIYFLSPLLIQLEYVGVNPMSIFILSSYFLQTLQNSPYISPSLMILSSLLLLVLVALMIMVWKS